MEEDPHLLDLIAAATQVPDPIGAFGAPAGEAPRAMEGDKPVVLGTGEARILRVQLLDHQGVERQRFRTGESVIVAVTFRTTEPLTDPIFGIALFRSDGVYVFGPNTGFDEVLHGTWHGVYTFFLHYPRLPLLTGMFRLSIAIFDAGHLHPHVWHNQLYDLEVAQDVEDHGLVQLPHQWGMLRWYEPR
jgi:hypothetical protein